MNLGMGEVLTWRHASQESGWSVRNALKSAGRAPLKRKSSAVSKTLFSHKFTLFATIHKPQPSRSAIQWKFGVSACMNSRKRGGCSRTLRPLSGPLHRGGGATPLGPSAP